MQAQGIGLNLLRLHGFNYRNGANKVEVPETAYRISRNIGICFVSEHSVRPETRV